MKRYVFIATALLLTAAVPAAVVAPSRRHRAAGRRPDSRRGRRRSAWLLVLFVFLTCSPYRSVKNLDSPGSTVIAFGDSLTAGFGAGEGEDWPSRVSAATKIEVVNAGVSGDTTESALRRLEDDVLARNPRIVIVGLGGNDYLRGVPIASTEATLRQIVRKIQAQRAMVVLLGFRFPSLNADYEAMYERIAEEEGCLLVERTLKGILTDPKLKSDQIHPNAAGYALMAERVAGPLRKLVARANRERSA